MKRITWFNTDVPKSLLLLAFIICGCQVFVGCTEKTEKNPNQIACSQPPTPDCERRAKEFNDR